MDEKKESSGSSTRQVGRESEGPEGYSHAFQAREDSPGKGSGKGEMGQCEPIMRTVTSFPEYLVGSDGSIWSCFKYNGHQSRKISSEWTKLNPSPQKKTGYFYVTLFRCGRAHRRSVHSLVLTEFVGPCPVGMEACHNNGIGSDCSLSNLRWDTHSSNMLDRVKHGTDERGSKSPSAKLNESDVATIRKRIASGEMKKRIASDYQVAPSTISAIARGANWSWLEQI